MNGDTPKSSTEVFNPPEIGELVDAIVPVKPTTERAAKMKARIMGGIASVADTSSAELGKQMGLPRHKSSAPALRDFKTIAVGEREWTSYSPGVEICVLYEDATRRSVLLKMAPGSFLFPHKHESAEESLVLEGSAIIDDGIEIHAGDYQYAPGMSDHAMISSPQGCVVLVHGESSPKVKITLGLVKRLTGYFFRSNQR
jgi:anti-sigma factor ChrR (cupin superfamily)